MDAKERHELKDNDLAEFLENFGTFWNKHGNVISAVILFLVAGWFGLRYYKSYKATNQENAWADLASTESPPSYRERATENPGDVGLTNLALLRGAEGFHKQAIEQLSKADDSEQDVMSPEDSLSSAEKMYKQVLDSQSDAAYRANAAAGLANVAETRGNFESAREYWTQAKQIAESGRLSTIIALADTRIALLEDLARPIILGEEVEFILPEDFLSGDAQPDEADDVPVIDALPIEAPTEGDPIETPVVDDATSPADPG